MVKRTTIDIDEELLNRAKRALGAATTRATVHEALRRVADEGDAQRSERAQRQTLYFEQLRTRVDLDVLRSEEMWR